jgi:HK97 family phage major capsid protein
MPTKERALFRELRQIEAEQRALDFYATKSNDTWAQKRSNAETLNLEEFLMTGKPNSLLRGISDLQSETFGPVPDGGRSGSTIWLPTNHMATRSDLAVGTSALGGYTVETSIVRQLTPVLRNKMVCANAGCTILENVRGAIRIPAQATSVAGTWLAENTQLQAGTNDFSF